MKTKTKYAVIVATLLVVLLASPALAADSPPALPTLPPDEPTTGDTTTTETTDTVTTTTGTTGTTTGTTASTASSGPVETAAIVGLAVIAFWGIKKYLSSKKYQL